MSQLADLVVLVHLGLEEEHERQDHEEDGPEDGDEGLLARHRSPSGIPPA